MANVSMGGNRVVIYADKMNKCKHPVLFVDVCSDEICQEEGYEGEEVQKIKITPIAHFKSKEAAKIFEDALRRMFENDGEVRLLQNFDEYCKCMDIDMRD